MTTVQTNTVDPTLLASVNGSRGATNSTQEAQDRFLTLLVTQMKNQDPLNPMDNAQVTSQLAQLSTVSGIEKLNTTVAAMNVNFQASQNLQAANMIGHGVIAPGSSIQLQDGKSVYGVELPQNADNVEISIKDASGLLVRKVNVGVMPFGVNTMTWDGKTDSGAVAANGNYTFEVSASLGSTKLDATRLSFGLVSSITANAQGAKLNVENLGDIGMADVRQIF
jgi:flagellar basal-body rod modification protein FlgD